MAYSKQVIERFEGVLNSPEQFSVEEFDTMTQMLQQV